MVTDCQAPEATCTAIDALSEIHFYYTLNNSRLATSTQVSFMFNMTFESAMKAVFDVTEVLYARRNITETEDATEAEDYMADDHLVVTTEDGTLDVLAELPGVEGREALDILVKIERI
jgi:hypothetical protein